MICYRAETSCANLLSDNFNKSLHEKRALVKSIINSHADIIPDYQNNQLTVKIYSQANPRMNYAIEKAIDLLNVSKKTSISALHSSEKCLFTLVNSAFSDFASLELDAFLLTKY